MESNTDDKELYDDLRHLISPKYNDEISNKVIKKLRKNLKKLTRQNGNGHGSLAESTIKKIISKKKKFTKQEKEKYA